MQTPNAPPNNPQSSPNPLQALDTDVQNLTRAVNRIGEILSAAGTPPTVTGSRGGNVALANLLTVLAAAGIVVDATTP